MKALHVLRILFFAALIFVVVSALLKADTPPEFGGSSWAWSPISPVPTDVWATGAGKVLFLPLVINDRGARLYLPLVIKGVPCCVRLE